MKRLPKTVHLKVLENEYQDYVDRGLDEISDIHGDCSLSAARFNRVGFYLMHGSTVTDCWEEYRREDGSFVAVRSKRMEESFRFKLSLLRDDLPNKETRKLLQKVVDQGYRLPRKLLKDLRLAETRDSIREVYVNASKYAMRFHKKLKAEKEKRDGHLK